MEWGRETGGGGGRPPPPPPPPREAHTYPCLLPKTPIEAPVLGSGVPGWGVNAD